MYKEVHSGASVCINFILWTLKVKTIHWDWSLRSEKWFHVIGLSFLFWNVGTSKKIGIVYGDLVVVEEGIFYFTLLKATHIEIALSTLDMCLELLRVSEGKGILHLIGALDIEDINVASIPKELSEKPHIHGGEDDKGNKLEKRNSNKKSKDVGR